MDSILIMVHQISSILRQECIQGLVAVRLSGFESPLRQTWEIKGLAMMVAGPCLLVLGLACILRARLRFERVFDLARGAYLNPALFRYITLFPQCSLMLSLNVFPLLAFACTRGDQNEPDMRS
jgi:hypothetical protein